MPQVELRELEHIVAHGARVITWQVRDHDGWVPAHKHPAADVRGDERGPGTVWERVISIDLPAGTLLLRTQTDPAPAGRKSPLEYLMGERRTAGRRSRRRYFRVGQRGELTPVR
ncbi:MAG TPA: hypothetical protein VKZ49_05300 [Polyangiaceae bacterium]|nr:hypothetical protein [Polyangiaceae bacterium]